MGLRKNIEYAINCENVAICDNWEDYESEIRYPKRHFEKLGYRLIDGKWYCKECAIN